MYRYLYLYLVLHSRQLATLIPRYEAGMAEWEKLVVIRVDDRLVQSTVSVLYHTEEADMILISYELYSPS